MKGLNKYRILSVATPYVLLTYIDKKDNTNLRGLDIITLAFSWSRGDGFESRRRNCCHTITVSVNIFVERQCYSHLQVLYYLNSAFGEIIGMPIVINICQINYLVLSTYYNDFECIHTVGPTIIWNRDYINIDLYPKIDSNVITKCLQ